jgi:RNA polymerase sigma-70 factor (ECF subfamily)
MNQKKLDKLMVNLKAGSTSALQDIYSECYKGVYSFIYPILRNSADCEDVTQNTFIQVYQTKDKYNEEYSARNWILTIAKNLALNELNKKKREVQTDFNENPNMYSYTEEYNETPLLDLAKKILKDTEYQILYMHIVGDMKHKEIAEILSMPLGTVTWSYKNAIEKLKKETKGKEVM